MRISDWSSDVCSSDLLLDDVGRGLRRMAADLQQRQHQRAELVAHRNAGEAQMDRLAGAGQRERRLALRSEEHTSELQSLMRISYAVFCLKKKKKHKGQITTVCRSNTYTAQQQTVRRQH